MALWEDLNMPEFERLRGRTQTVILPVGSLEEHGPHLPLGTDTFHALEVARRLARERPVAVAPPLFYGVCRSTREHPGTVSLRGDTLRALVLDLGREFYRQGFRNLVIISGHAGGIHMAALLEAGETLLAELAEIRVAVVNVLDLLREVLAQNPHLVRTKGDAHAGEVETAIMRPRTPIWLKARPRRSGPLFPNISWCGTKGAFGPGGCGATQRKLPRPRGRRFCRPRCGVSPR